MWQKRNLETLRAMFKEPTYESLRAHCPTPLKHENTNIISAFMTVRTDKLYNLKLV